MRQTLILSTMAVMAACTPAGNTPWDQNHDGLITACEGLNPQACDATVGCEPTPMVCTLECRDDGHGGCLPCGAEVCRPTPPPPVFDCSQLALNVCAVTPRCEVIHPPTCGGGISAPEFADQTTRPTPAPPLPGHDVCRNRQPSACEELSNDACLAQSGCALEGFGAVCDIACDPIGNCPPCAISQLRCVTIPPPDVCGSRDPNVCSIDGRCELQAWACPAICIPDGNGGCKPCDAPPFACVPVSPTHCAGLDPSSCEAAGCSLIELACDASCRADGNGGCLPCDAYMFVCSDSGSSGGGSVPPQP